MVIRLPWLIPRLTVAVPRAVAVIFLGSSMLKLFLGPMACFDDPWAPANGAMGPLELILAWCLWSKRFRSFGALLGCGTMVGASTLLTWAHYNGLDIGACGCFGPIRMPYAIHVVLSEGLLATCVAVLLAEAFSDDRPKEDPLRSGIAKPSAFFGPRRGAGQRWRPDPDPPLDTGNVI
jgi:hypothetical protein